jgi:hypothetical protein
MAITRVAVYANCDMATIVWQTDKLIPDCRGFALGREVSGAPGDAQSGFIRTWVGFAGQHHDEGQTEPSTVWPIQRYIWSDYVVSQGQRVRYRVIPMVGPAANLQKARQADWSAWTNWADVDTGKSKSFRAYFNRGIVPTQFLARQAGSSQQFREMLTEDIKTPQSKNRFFLSGPLRRALIKLLQESKEQGTSIYAALYELNDPELVTDLVALGANCNLILGSGA